MTYRPRLLGYVRNDRSVEESTKTAVGQDEKNKSHPTLKAAVAEENNYFRNAQW